MTKPTIPGYTESDLDSLTPDELDALQADTGDEEVIEAKEAAPAEEPAGDAPASEDTPAEEVSTDEAPADTRAYKADSPADAKTQLDAFKTAKSEAKSADKAAFKQLMDGEIDIEAYEAIKTQSEDAIDAANDSIAELNKAISKAEISGEMAAQEAARLWNGEVASLVTAAKAEGLDYKGNEALNKELNGLVRAFGQEATEQGMTDEGLKASKWALKQAHDVMKMRHADLLVKKAPEKVAAGQRHDLIALNKMPNADRALGDNDAIAKFSQLEGEDLERAMASMSKAEIDKLLASV